MEATSLTPQQEKLKALQELLPEAFAEGKIDWEKLKATLGEDINFSNERYVLNWAGKSDAFKVLQTPSTKTLIPAKEESINFDTTDNIFIEGENLEVLKVLQKSYFGKVKMIYIDPPYNTGNDSFIYPDKFSETKAEYEKRVGDKDEEGYMTKDGMFKKNSKENGQYHSNWLNMMMPRLYLAKNLLKQDGVIFVSIDDNEVHNLRLLMNEIFGEENFVASVIWKKKYSVANDSKYLSTSHDFILLYSKQKENFKINLLSRTEEQLNYYKNPDNDFRGVWQSTSLSVGRTTEKDIYPIITPSGKEYLPPKGAAWRFSKENFLELVKDNRIWFGENGDNTPRQKRFLSEVQDGITPSTVWDFSEVGHTDEGKKETTTLFDSALFDYPKPVRLLKRIIHLATKNSDLILDFFAGSGTTAHAVMELNKEDGGNRKYICVQLPELCDEKSEAFKAGYKTIAEISKERIRRAGESFVNGQL
ncbi:MAG: site-specific DNA-methyltransferase, partial [Sediminibacterium sp.]|nr:site-specific DNA-methyltransferase [Sediminibacterium sp.]